MIKVNLNYILRLRNIRQPYAFLKTLGFSHTISYELLKG